MFIQVPQTKISSYRYEKDKDACTQMKIDFYRSHVNGQSRKYKAAATLISSYK